MHCDTASDRLARNSVDGGKIIYLIDKGLISALKFHTFWFENSPQGKFMLNIAFAQSKHFVDNLSENVQRGIRQKLRMGELPGLAPIGYLNDLRTHTILKDPQRWQSIQKLIEAYATGERTLDILQSFSKSLGLTSWQNETFLSHSEIQRILKNSFYYGIFLYRGEMYQGTHEPIISKQLFDKVQHIMFQRGKPRKEKGLKPSVFRGLFTCGECRRMITAETHTKKSGLSFTYYRCTKKGTVCHQKYLEEKDLVRQVNSYIQKVALSDEWANKMLKQLERDKKEIANSNQSLVQNLHKELSAIESKIKRLLSAYLDEVLELVEYQKKKKELLEKKVSFKERLTNLGKGTDFWLEPMREWILSSNRAQGLETLEEKKDFLKNIGSNFILAGRKVRFSVSKPYDLLFSRKRFPNWGG